MDHNSKIREDRNQSRLEHTGTKDTTKEILEKVIAKMSDEKPVKNDDTSSAKNGQKVMKNGSQRVCIEDIGDEHKNDAANKILEQERLKEEQRQTIMQECIPIACTQGKQIMECCLNQWIQNQLIIRNVKEIQNIYGCTMNEILKDYRHAMDPSFYPEFAEKVTEQTKWLQVFVGHVQAAVEKFNSGVKKRFEFKGCFAPPNLEQVLEAEMKKMNQSLRQDDDGRYLFQFVLPACERLKKIYWQHNNLIMSVEHDNVSIFKLETKTFYNDLMKEYVKEKPYSLEKLTRLSTKLIEKCVDAFKKAFNPMTVSDDASNLEHELIKAFNTHKDANDIKLKKMQAEINKIITKFKTEYNSKMEKFLQSHPGGVEDDLLETEHRKVNAEIQKLFQMDVREKVRKDEPVEVHLKSLQIHIDKYLEHSVKDTNNRKIKQRKAREEEEKRERLKKEAEEKKQEAENAKRKQDEERKRVTDASNQLSSTSKSVTSNTTNQNADSLTQHKPSPSKINTSSGSNRKLPPLVFQLSMSRVAMGMMVDGKATILPNEFKEPSTPAVVGLTLEGTLVYGSEALGSVSEDDDRKNASSPQAWLIAQHFIRGDNFVPVKTIQINGEMCEITVEFLLGFLLRQLKSTVEKERSGTISTTLITIPFWLTSAQRLQVKDAGRVAGFSEVYLVNEPSAAAYACAYSESRQRSVNDIIVLSENSDYVDACVFSYDGFKKKIQMIAHCGDYCLGSKKHGLWNSFKKAIVDGVHNLFGSNSGGETKEDKEQMKKRISKACSTAIGYAQNSKNQSVQNNSKPKETLIVFESSKWRDVLESVGRANARLICNMKPDEVVLTGAVLLSQNPQLIGESIRDMLAFDVLRSCLPETGKVVMGKDEVLPIANFKRTSTLPRGKGESFFFQSAMECVATIGSLKRCSIKSSDVVTVHFQITNEAIVSLQDVSVEKPHNTRSTSSNNGYLHEGQYTWVTPNLTKGRVEELMSFLECLSPQQESELSKAQTILKDKCKEMQDSMSSGKFKFKTDLGKGYAEKQIQEALDFANHPNATMDDVEKQMEKMIKIHSKYAF